MFLYGASGHGKVIKEILESQNRVVSGFVDDNPNILEIANLPVIHSIKNVNEIIISIGNNAARKEVAKKIKCQIADAAIHREATLSKSATIQKGTVIMAGAIINADTKIGQHCIINTGASIDHDCQLADFIHISPHATLCGNVNVGEGSWIGAGSTVIQGITIGKWAIIGAGSVVVEDVPDGFLAYGNPCRLVKKLEIEGNN